jgi:hypothetical protein
MKMWENLAVKIAGIGGAQSVCVSYSLIVHISFKVYKL